MVALPLGLVIVGIPARMLGYLTGQRMLDVIVDRDLGRFLPLLVIVAVWALIAALLVSLFNEGGRWLLARRRRRKQQRLAAPDPSVAVAARRGRGDNGAGSARRWP